MFTKQFLRFINGLRELCEVSFDAKDALMQLCFGESRDPREAENPERQAVENLAANVAFARPTDNGVDWGRCSITISASSVFYQTGGGLWFGWEVDSRDYQSSREFGEGGNRWTFFVAHPLGQAPQESSLRQSATAHGWKEEGEETPVIHIRSPRLHTRLLNSQGDLPRNI